MLQRNYELSSSNFSNSLDSIQHTSATEYKGKTLTLFHQTGLESANEIMKNQIMQPGVSGAFGGGIYFATTVDAARRKGAHGKEVILIVTVTFANPVRVFQPCPNLTFESLIKNGFDSVVADCFNGTEFVIYDSSPISRIDLGDSIISDGKILDLSSQSVKLSGKVVISSGGILKF